MQAHSLINTIFTNIKDNLKTSITGNQALAVELRNSLKDLDEAMKGSVDNFAKDYQWFLERIRELEPIGLKGDYHPLAKGLV